MTGPDQAALATLLTAARQNDVETLQDILAAHPDFVNAATATGETPLIMAIYAGAHDAIDVLRTAGAHPTIFEAAALGDALTCEDLLNADPSLAHAYTFDGWTALHLAAHFGQVETAKLLLGHRANPSARSHNNLDNEPLHAACASLDNLDVATLLLDSGADVNAREHGGYTPLHQAADGGDEPLATLLLAHGADRSARTDDGKTPRDIAQASGHQALADLLHADS